MACIMVCFRSVFELGSNGDKENRWKKFAHTYKKKGGNRYKEQKGRSRDV